MSKQVPIGAKGAAEERVQYEHTLTAHQHNLPPIYTTPDLVRLMEVAGANALQPFCEPGEISVSTAVNVQHRTPVAMNSVVRAAAVVEASNDRVHQIHVIVSEGKHEIGAGTVTRTIVKMDEYLAQHDIPKP